MRQASRERRDLEVEKLRQKYAYKVASAQSRVRTAEERVARESSQAQQAKLQTAVGFGGAVLGALVGRKVLSAGNVGRATTAARSVGRASQQAEDVDRATAGLDVVRKQLADLQAQIEGEIQALAAAWEDDSLFVELVSVAPRKADIAVERVALAWLPHRIDAEGSATPAW
jgi:hypothetical protein